MKSILTKQIRNLSLINLQNYILNHSVNYNSLPKIYEHLLPKNNSIHLRNGFCSVSNTCWNCKINNNVNTFFCKNCGSLLDVKVNKDYFQLLGFHNNFDINNNDLTKKYRELQSQLHPDKFSKKSKYEQEISRDWSSLINKAYKTLSIPIDRAEYILKLNNITLPEENSSFDKEFLLEMMEKNEEVEDADNLDSLNDLLKDVQTSLKSYYNELDVLLKNNDLDMARKLLVKLKYYTSIEKTIKNKIYQFK